ncbi:O-antigen ligase [Vreelandella subterranea]|uniref:O-antigen ligase n=1 Tax=Vreelandella subterranea TaxID=416874 RepID=A0A1H9RQJ3_9GAMM|nr:O-antigen ligase family protein [Halomonas subterranea]SER74976.1 O-antigen ligase [Halomonas subterranea]
MYRLFAPERAAGLNLAALFLVLVLLIATPLRSHIVIALLLLYALSYLWVNRASLVFNRFDVVVVALLASYAVSRLPVFVLDDFSSRYVSPGLHMAAVIPIYLMMRHAGSAIQLGAYRRWLEWGAIVGSLGASGVALYQTQWLGWQRADGFLFSINFGYLACAMAFICFAMLRGSPRKVWLVVAGLAALLAMLLTLTRGSVIAVPPLLLLLLVLNLDVLGWKRLLMVVGLAMSLAAVAYLASNSVQQRVAYSVDEVHSLLAGDVSEAVSSGGRLQLWMAASHAFKERPLVGLTYPEREALNAELVEQGVVTDWVLSVDRGHAHSQYFEMLASGGLLGILAIFGYLLAPGVYHLRLVILDRNNVYAQTGLVFTTGFAIYCLTEAAIHHEMMTAVYAYMQVNLLVLAHCLATQKQAAVT